MGRVLSWAEWIERWITYTATSGIVLSVLWGVLTRYVTAKPAVWTSELSGILFTWAVFIGAATAFREGRHIRIDLLPLALPENGRRAMELFGRLATLAFLAYAALLSYEMMIEGATRPSPVLRIPFSYVYLAPLLSFSLMAVSDLLQLLGLNVPDGQPAREDAL
ncbi:TRAP transporter small permease [Notoacmeibacter marinus]|uniref:TRAP transporter small permease n=1 Tax=Notoacmeibacter marinus TaxID=1876515 RepID=UPI000DF1D9E4|nr:TRAP transporter small permease [Notoacmeibacter marinus]